MSGTRAPFDPELLERLSSGVPGYAALQELVALAVAACAPPSPAPKVLDLGCGTGAGMLAVARALPGAELVGCDPAAPMVEAARARFERGALRGRFVVGALPEVAAEAPFDAVVCTLVLHFVPPDERPAVLRGIHAALRPGGALVVSAPERPATPEIEGIWSRIRRCYAATKGLTTAELTAREAETRGKVHPLVADELPDALVAAGFGAASPLYQLLTIRTWIAIA